MNLEKLKLAEAQFLDKYPEGFDHPNLIEIGKKHKMDQMVRFAHDKFKETCFDDTNQVLEDLNRIISRASMVSMFEKPKFRDFVFSLSHADRDLLLDGLKKMLHGNLQKGFEQYAEVLSLGKLAKWSLMTIVLAYFRPTEEVFVKPTTAKGIIAHFEINHLVYKPAPTWTFYEGYRHLINDMKTHVNSRLSPSNAAFSGFLMMTCM